MPGECWDDRLNVLLTHVVEAIGLSGLGAHERHVRPLAVAVRVAFDEVVRRLSVHDPVTQELAYATSVDDSVPEHTRPRLGVLDRQITTAHVKQTKTK